MSSALAMVLTAAMAVPGNGPEMVSAEMEQGLDLGGQWEGTAPCTFRQLITKVEVSDGRIRFSGEGGTIRTTRWKVIDEGQGRLRIEWEEDGAALGIYQWRGEHLFICTREASKGRPTDFQLGGSGSFNSVLILHRVKPRK